MMVLASASGACGSFGLLLVPGLGRLAESEIRSSNATSM
jgi:hypothetical protein